MLEIIFKSRCSIHIFTITHWIRMENGIWARRTWDFAYYGDLFCELKFNYALHCYQMPILDYLNVQNKWIFILRIVLNWRGIRLNPWMLLKPVVFFSPENLIVFLWLCKKKDYTCHLICGNLKVVFQILLRNFIRLICFFFILCWKKLNYTFILNWVINIIDEQRQ